MIPTRKNYRQIARDMLTQIAGGDVTEEFSYVAGKTLYGFSSTPVKKILEVKGLLNGTERIFSEGTDYRLSKDSLEWLGGGDHPDEGTDFTVGYTFTRPSGLSDVNPGSVVRTIVEAISREIDYLYAQMDNSYLSGFLDTATGEALDMVVSILGIKRKPPQPSSGNVTFGRSSEPETSATNGEVHLYDGSPEYALEKPLVKEVLRIRGTAGGSSTTFKKDVDYTLVGRNIRWLPEGNRPDTRTVFRVDYENYQQILIPKGSGVATFTPVPEESRSFTTNEDSFLKPSEEGRWEADVPVVCEAPGRWGNVLAGTVTVMPSPVQGVEYVINQGDITNGVEEESDSELRERAKHAMEFAGRATVSSLESAVGAVEGVRSLLVADMPDGVPGIVRVIVDGGDPDEIKRVIDETRAAGIRVEFARPRTIYIDVSMVLTLPEGMPPAPATAEAERLVRSYISSQGIGDDVLFSRIIDTALEVRNVIDVTQVTITAHKEAEVIESQKENIAITSEERAEPRNLTINFEVRE